MISNRDVGPGSQAKRGHFIAAIAPPLLLAVGSLLLFAYLLKRFPYHGFYSADGYAYYYQARALWEQIAGVIPQGFQLYTADGLQHWPVGYHLQIMSGFLFSGISPTGGWLLTIVSTALCPSVLYLILQRLLPASTLSNNRLISVISGLIAGVLISLNATFVRTGLSIMSDVPMCFWSLLAIYFFVRADPITGRGSEITHVSRRAQAWCYSLGGFCLGIAVLIRYGAIILALPIAIYILLAHMHRGDTRRTSRMAPVLWSIPAFLVAITPQLIYLLTHNPGTGVNDFLSGISVGNIFASTTQSTDGAATFEQPMIAFYALGPIWQAQAGFYSLFLLPAIAIGIVFLLNYQRRILVFLIAWYATPAIFYSMTPYQAHRFALIYLPVIAILIGFGCAYLVRLLTALVPRLAGQFEPRRLPMLENNRAFVITLSVMIFGNFGIGSLQNWNSVRDWVATHAKWEQDSHNLVGYIQGTIEDDDIGKEPHIITLGLSAPIYHETQWPVIELYFADPVSLGKFLSASEANIAVVPEQTLSTQWANTPTGNNWQWLKSNYTLDKLGSKDNYTIYAVSRTSTSP